MTFKSSLRARVTLAFALSAALLAAAFYISHYWIYQVIEAHFVADTLGPELDTYIAHKVQPLSPRSKIYETPVDVTDGLPPYLIDLDPGTHEVYVGDREYHVAVLDRDGMRYYLAHDATGEEQWEAVLHKALLTGTFLFTVLAVALGYWISGRVIAPVTRLASEVKHAQIDPEGPLLTTDYGDDEVGYLAKTFEGYSQRLYDFARREEEFTADVSHELRTSVAVVRTTAEFLISQVSNGLRLPLERIQRSAIHMGELIEAILILAREAKPSKEETASTCPLEPVVREALESYREELTRKGLSVQVHAEGGPSVQAPRAAIAVVVGNLLGNAIAYTRKDHIRLNVDPHGVTVEGTGSGIPAEVKQRMFDRVYRGSQAARSGSGLGLAIVGRLCKRYGWRMDIVSTEGQGTRASLRFVP